MLGAASMGSQFISKSQGPGFFIKNPWPVPDDDDLPGNAINVFAGNLGLTDKGVQIHLHLPLPCPVSPSLCEPLYLSASASLSASTSLLESD